MWKRTHSDRTRGLLLTGLKAAGSAAVAIAVASAIHLQFSATAGIIAILSLMGTKRETMKVALGRLMAYAAALLMPSCASRSSAMGCLLSEFTCLFSHRCAMPVHGDTRRR